MKDKIVLGAQFEQEEADYIKAIALREDMTVSQIVRRAVREYIRQHKQSPLHIPIAHSDGQEQAAA
jgi:Ribbon-helix-helix protein, copG family